MISVVRTGSIRPPPAPCTTRQAISDRPRWSDAIFRRAHERGEIDLDRLSPAVLEMPFDLPRHDMLMTLKRVPDERITSIVDDLFLPLVTGTSRR